MRRTSRSFLQWLSLGALVGAACGCASALFLWSLDRVTQVRLDNEWLVYALPIAGLVVGLVFERWGKPIRGGNNLILDTLHDDAEQIPLRMAPMVLGASLITHLFGGSAGREGTAVQMGASLADEIAHRFGVSRLTRREILAAGMAGGFGSVFGTPIAGALFGLEVVSVGRMSYEALLPALVAAVVGNAVTHALGIVHTPYPAVAVLPLDALLMAKWLVFGGAVALVTVAFVELTHRLRGLYEARLRSLPVRLAVGGAVIVAAWKLVGTSDYLGLGIPVIQRSFTDPALPIDAFAMKLVFTALTVGAGYIGGEVTPLFFVGAALGNVLARLLGLPLAMGAGVGMAAVFGAAANTPIALSVMAVELLGAPILPHVFIVTVTAYLLTGHRGIYPAQRITRAKHGGPDLGPPVRLTEMR